MLAEYSGFLLSCLLISTQLIWRQQIRLNVPQPYLDEVFHVPQAQAYWSGNWSHWDDKITTPPGLYLFSILVNKIYKPDETTADLTTQDLRYSNSVVYVLTLSVLAIWSVLAFKHAQIVPIIRKEFCIMASPLFLFFSGLYYTDLFSVCTIMLTYCTWQGSIVTGGEVKFLLQIMHFLGGLLSLGVRQTNIFWVAVYLGGLQAVVTIKRRAKVHDPAILDAHLEDLPTTIISLTASAFSCIPSLIVDLWPHLGLLGAFAGFITWNGGVVLGDKSNHVATIHLAQMLYLWPFIVFLSWPAILPRLATFRLSASRLPRLWVVVLVALSMTAIVHYNTIAHKFLLADNRHYTFYAFKILRSNPWMWYALIPAYAICAHLSIQALGTMPTREKANQNPTSPEFKQSMQSKAEHEDSPTSEDNRVTFLIVWLVSTALSLVTAPLVEPRYFMLPWLMWRLHVPYPDLVLSESALENSDGSLAGRVRSGLVGIARKSLWIELAWYTVINTVTFYKFLYQGFEWRHEPGQIQRFMW